MLNMDSNKNCDLSKKRSSLKTQQLFPEGMSYEEYMNHKSKKLQWDSKVEEIEVIKQETHNLLTTEKFKEAMAHFQDLDPKDDVYLHKLHEVNQIRPTKEVVEEIKEIIEEDKNLKFQEVEVVKNKEIKTVESSNVTFEKDRKKSIKDEFSLAKDLLKLKLTQDDELEPEVIVETMKNTLYNKCVGKLDLENSDSDSDS